MESNEIGKLTEDSFALWEPGKNNITIGFDHGPEVPSTLDVYIGGPATAVAAALHAKSGERYFLKQAMPMCDFHLVQNKIPRGTSSTVTTGGWVPPTGRDQHPTCTYATPSLSTTGQTIMASTPYMRESSTSSTRASSMTGTVLSHSPTLSRT